MLLDKSYDIAEFSTRPAPVALPAWIDIEGRPAVVMERAQTLIGSARRTQGDITANHIDDVVGFFDLLDQGYPVARQGPPKGRKENWKPDFRCFAPMPEGRQAAAREVPTRRSCAEGIPCSGCASTPSRSACTLVRTSLSCLAVLDQPERSGGTSAWEKRKAQVQPARVLSPTLLVRARRIIAGQ